MTVDDRTYSTNDNDNYGTIVPGPNFPNDDWYVPPTTKQTITFKKKYKMVVAVRNSDLAGLGALGFCEFLANRDVTVEDVWKNYIILGVKEAPSLSDWQEDGVVIVEIGNNVENLIGRLQDD